MCEWQVFGAGSDGVDANAASAVGQVHPGTPLLKEKGLLHAVVRGPKGFCAKQPAMQYHAVIRQGLKGLSV